MEENIEEIREVTNEEKVTDEDKKIKKHKKDDKKDKQIEVLQNEISELKEKNVRVTAEMVNSLRRKDEEVTRMLKYSNESLILDIIPIVDNFERALNSLKDDSNEKKGIEMIYNSLKNILEKYEVKEIDALDKEFDPNYHQAVMQGEDEEKNSNIVIEVMQKGYTYKDRVLRPAMVKVNK